MVGDRLLVDLSSLQSSPPARSLWTSRSVRLFAVVQSPRHKYFSEQMVFSENGTFLRKVTEVQCFVSLQLLSLLAFICEEVVSQCTLCGGLYFFELVSSSAFLLSLLILIVYCTPVYDKVDAGKIKLSVSMKKYYPHTKNVEVWESCIVLFSK